MNDKKKAKMEVLKELLNFGDEEIEGRLKPKSTTVISIGLDKPKMDELKEEESKKEPIETYESESPEMELSEEEKNEIDKIRQKYKIGK